MDGSQDARKGAGKNEQEQDVQWGPRGTRGGQGMQMGPGTCGRRVVHIGGAWDGWMGAEMHKRGPGHAKGGWEARCTGGRGKGCVGTAWGMGTGCRTTVGGLGRSGQMRMCVGTHQMHLHHRHMHHHCHLTHLVVPHEHSDYHKTLSPPPLSTLHFSGMRTPSLTLPSSYPNTTMSSMLVLTTHIPGLHALPCVHHTDHGTTEEKGPTPLHSMMLIGKVSKPWLHAVRVGQAGSVAMWRYEQCILVGTTGSGGT